MNDSSNPYIRSLLTADPIRKPLLHQCIQSLHLPPGSIGMDIGCGIGLQAMLLAEFTYPQGTVIAVDISPALLAFAHRQIVPPQKTTAVHLSAASFTHLPFRSHTFDWIWSADCIGYPVSDLAPLLSELVRVCKPGAGINLLAWSSQQLLPGYPLLEASLNATCSAYIPYLQNTPPEAHFSRIPYWFQQAGLVNITARTFVADIQAPLTPQQSAALTDVLQMLWGTRQPQVPEQDWSAFQYICSPESPGCILNAPGYYAFFTYTLFQGFVP